MLKFITNMFKPNKTPEMQINPLINLILHQQAEINQLINKINDIENKMKELDNQFKKT